jgi:hypothetical protein
MFKLFKEYIETDNKPADLKLLLGSDLKEVIDDYLNTNLNNEYVYHYFIDFFKGILFNPAEDERINFLNDQFANFCEYTALLGKDSPFETIVGFSGIKHYLEIFAIYISKESQNFNINIINDINKILEGRNKVRGHNIYLTEEQVEVLKIYVLKIIIREKSWRASGLINYDFESAGINWIRKSAFETQSSAFGFEPYLPSLESCRRTHAETFQNIVDNFNDNRNRSKFAQFIRDASKNSDMKFVLIQFFMLKVYAYFTNPTFANSFICSEYRAIFNHYFEDIRQNLGIHIATFINNLITNFQASNTDIFKISQETSFTKLSALITILQAFNIILSYNNLPINQIFNSQQQSFEYLRNFYIPGGYEDPSYEARQVVITHVDNYYHTYGVLNGNGLYECECGYLYYTMNCTKVRPHFTTCLKCGIPTGASVYNELVSTSRCLINYDNRTPKEVLLSDLRSRLRSAPGFYYMIDVPSNYLSRNNNLISFRVQDLVNNGIFCCLYENNILHDSTPFNILFASPDQTINPLQYFKNRMDNDIEVLATILNGNDVHVSLTLFLDKILSINLESEDKLSFRDGQDRDTYELKLRLAIENINDLNINEYKRIYSDGSNFNIMKKIDEQYDDNEPSELIMKFKPVNKGTWDDLEKKLEKNPKKYFFLDMLINCTEEINLLLNLSKILNLTNLMMDKLNHKLKRQEAKDKRISEYLEYSIRPLYEEFKNAWKNISNHITYFAKRDDVQYGYKVLPQLKDIHEDLAIAFLLPDDAELGYGMYMCATLQYLGQIQNSLLDNFHEIVENNETYKTQFVINKNLYPIQKISENEIIDYNNNDYFKDLYVKYYTIYSNEIGRNSNIEYNFKKIDMHVASRLFLNKKKLDYENINKILYQFELLPRKGSLITDIKTKIPQILMDRETNIEVQTYLEDKVMKTRDIQLLNQVFRSLDYILCQLKYNSKSKTVSSLGEFLRCLSTKTICTRLRDPPFNRLKLSCIVHLYQLVENHIFNFEINYLSPDYCKPLDTDLRERLMGYLKSIPTNAYKYPTLNEFQAALERFILRYLFTTMNPEISLRDYILREDLWNLDVVDEKFEAFACDFPEEVKLGHAKVVWELVKGIIDELQRPQIRETNLHRQVPRRRPRTVD